MRDYIFIVGTGKLAFWCAKEMEQRGKVVRIYEYKTAVLSGLEKLSKKHGLFYEEFSEGKLYEALNTNADKEILIISVQNRYIFSQAIIDMPHVKIINFHPGLLPHYAGVNPEAWAIYCGEEKAGITWHMVSNEIDAGNIIIQRFVPIDSNDTSITLLQKLNEEGMKAFSAIISLIINDEEVTYAQDITKRKLYCRADVPNDGVLDLKWDDRKKSQFLRAMDYGKMYNLGKVKVAIAGITYVVNAYTVCKHSSIDTIGERDYIVAGSEEDIILRELTKYE